MNTLNKLTRWQALVWLWRHDPEAKWYWLRRFLRGVHLREDVAINYRDFGLTSKGET